MEILIATSMFRHVILGLILFVFAVGVVSLVFEKNPALDILLAALFIAAGLQRIGCIEKPNPAKEEARLQRELNEYRLQKEERERQEFYNKLRDEVQYQRWKQNR